MQQGEAEKLVEIARGKVALEVIKEGKWKEALAKMSEKERKDKEKDREEEEVQKKADQEATLRVVAQHALDERDGIEKYTFQDTTLLADLADHDQIEPEAVHRLSNLKTSDVSWFATPTGDIGVSSVEIRDKVLVDKTDKKRALKKRAIVNQRQNKPARETFGAEDDDGSKTKSLAYRVLVAAQDNETGETGGPVVTWEDYGNYEGNPDPTVVVSASKPGEASVVTLEDYENYEEVSDPTNVASSSKLGTSSKVMERGSTEFPSQLHSGQGAESHMFGPSQENLRQSFLFDFDQQSKNEEVQEDDVSADEDSTTLTGDESPRSNMELSAKARGKLPAKGKRRAAPEASTTPMVEASSDAEDPQTKSRDAESQMTATSPEEAHAIGIPQLKNEPSLIPLDEVRGRRTSVRKERSDSINFLRKRTISRESSVSASRPTSPPRWDSTTKLDSSVLEEAEEDMGGAKSGFLGCTKSNSQPPEFTSAKKDTHESETYRADSSTGFGAGAANTNPTTASAKAHQANVKKLKPKKAKRNYRFQADIPQEYKGEAPGVSVLSDTAENTQSTQAIGKDEPVEVALNEEYHEDLQPRQAVEVEEPFATGLEGQIPESVKSAGPSKSKEHVAAATRKRTPKKQRSARTAKNKEPVGSVSQSGAARKGRQTSTGETEFPEDNGLADFTANNKLLLLAMTDPGLIAGGLTAPRPVQEGVMDDLSENELEITERNLRHPRELAPYTPYADKNKWLYKDKDQRVNLANLKAKYALVDKPSTYILDPAAATVVRWSPHCEGASAIVTLYQTYDNVPLIEYDQARNRLIIYPHTQPWVDLRNDPLHPDFLPGYKLAEYQAYEYAGFPVWRHDRAVHKCAFPGCLNMLEDYDPNVLICNGCGTKSYVRYCNRPHVLMDIENHWQICGTTAIKEVVDWNTQPSRFYRRYPAIVEKHGFNSEQRHRQRANNIGATLTDYGLFTDSKILYFGVIFTNWYDKDRFNRCFNACLFDITQVQILSFMFRIIRHSLRKDGVWTQDKKIVLVRQFKAEFDFDYDAHEVSRRDICDCEWFGEAFNINRCSEECKKAYEQVGHTFRTKGIEQMLTAMEAQHWILRVWRRHHPRKPKDWEERMRGVGFVGVPKWQQSIDFRPAMGEGWDGWGNTENELCL